MKLELYFPITAEYTDKNGKTKKLNETEMISFYHLIQRYLQYDEKWQYCQKWDDFISRYRGVSGFATKMEKMQVTAVVEKNGLYGRLTFHSSQALTETEKNEFVGYIHEQIEQGWGKRLSGDTIPVDEGELRVQFWNPYSSLFLIDDQMPSENVPPKYRITDIQHPVYKECYRIQAIRDVDQDIRIGELGGFIEKERNLDHSGKCWISGNAVCRDTAQVSKDSRVTGNAEIRGQALVTGTSLLQGHCLVEGNAYVKDAVICDSARVTGDAVVESEKESKGFPVISGDSKIYGSIIGQVVITNSTVFPSEQIFNPGDDQFVIENGIKDVVSHEQIQKEALTMKDRSKDDRYKGQIR